jgi:hypothetical protein
VFLIRPFYTTSSVAAAAPVAAVIVLFVDQADVLERRDWLDRR